MTNENKPTKRDDIMQSFISGSKIGTYPKNPNTCSIHTRHELMELGGYWSSDPLYCFNFDNAIPLTESSVLAVLSIDGITKVSVAPYEIVISKAHAFSWEELNPKIALELSRYLPANYA